MKILCLILCFLWFVPVCAQSSSSAKDTLWIEPFLSSLKTVLSNAEQVDYVLLESKYANEVCELPAGVYLARSISEIENYATQVKRVYYVYISSLKMDSWGMQIEWRNISVGYHKRTGQLNYVTHVNYSLCYDYNGTRWSRGPSSIQTINHANHKTTK